MKSILLILIACISLFLLGSAVRYYSKFHTRTKGNASTAPSGNRKLLLHLKQQASAIIPYAKQHGYNTGICFLIDMEINSGQNRFFVYDLKKDSILDAGQVTHGRCNKSWLTGRQYGNKVGCGCTSLGKYRIGKPYHGRFGLAYKLHGLDSTNSNAFKRYVVLHAHECVPESGSPSPICQSDGCPTVSPGFLKRLATVIDGSKKPVLMCIADSQ